MKRILLFTDSLGAGGAQRQLVGLAVMLQRVGYKVKVCTYHNIDFYKNYLDDNCVENELIPNGGNTKNRIWAVRQYFKREKPDWVIVYQETPSLIACVAKMLGCKYRLIVSERNTTQRIGINERVRFFLYHWADAIVPNSYAQESFLTNYHPWMKKKITTITNFVDLERFVFVKKEKRDCPLIVVAATIWPPKNTLGLIEAAKLLKDRGENFLIEWFGLSELNTDYQNQCLQLIEEYDLGECVKLLPKTKHIQEKYKDCDFFCLPSFYEGTPNVICEAIACGRPVLCSCVCDNPYYVSEDKNGFLFNPNSCKSVVDAFLRAFRMKEDEYERFCQNSRKNAERMLSDVAFLNKYVNIINNG